MLLQLICHPSLVSERISGVIFCDNALYKLTLTFTYILILCYGFSCCFQALVHWFVFVEWEAKLNGVQVVAASHSSHTPSASVSSDLKALYKSVIIYLFYYLFPGNFYTSQQAAWWCIVHMRPLSCCDTRIKTSLHHICGLPIDPTSILQTTVYGESHKHIYQKQREALNVASELWLWKHWHVAFHKAEYKHPSGEVGNSVAVLYIYESICLTNY